MPKDPLEHEGLPGVVEIGRGFSIDRREVPYRSREELVRLLEEFRRERLARLRLEAAEKFAASCDVVGEECFDDEEDNRSDGAPHNID